MQSLEDLKEEVFCLKFELNTLSEVLLKNESERWVPGFLHEATEFAHLDRYKLACQFSKGKNVIDVACGVGKGSYMISSQGEAKCVNGFDIDRDAIKYARWRHKSDNVHFEVANAEQLSFQNEFDLAISFETIEHLKKPDLFLKNVHESLKENGQLLVSTPISHLAIDYKPKNPYHVQEWGFIEFQNLIKKYFSIEDVYVQLFPVNLTPKKSFSARVFNKFRNILNIKNTEQFQDNDSSIKHFPTIYKFLDQATVNELGKTKIGFQIVLARKVV